MVMNGARLGAAIRQNPALANLPLPFISVASEEVVQKSFGDDDGFVSKPYDIDAPLSIVGALVSGSRKQRVRSRDVDESMRHLLEGIELPPGA